MKINLKSIILDQSGKPVQQDGVDATVGAALVMALLATYGDEPQLSGADKFRRYQLALAVEAGNGDVSIEDAALLKTLTAKIFPPLIMGRVWEAIEQTSQLRAAE